MKKEIVISLTDDAEISEWVLPFNNIQPAEIGAVILYIKNLGETTISLDCIKVSSDSKSSVVQVHSEDCGCGPWQDRNLHAHAHVRGQWLRDALPPEFVEWCHEPVLQ